MEEKTRVEKTRSLKLVLNVDLKDTWRGTVLRELISLITRSRKEIPKTETPVRIHTATISEPMIVNGATESTTQLSLVLDVARSGQQKPRLSIVLLTAWSSLQLLPRKKETWS